MTEPENFLSRWSRLKRESGAESDSAHALAPAPVNPISAPAPDLSNLPTVESIGPGSDIRAFLQAGVPADLVRAALRSAWASEPAIRGFIEIADNQWDFNEPDAIPGFGALGIADQARNLVARAISGPADLSAAAPAVRPGSDTIESEPAIGEARGEPAVASAAASGDETHPGPGAVHTHGTALPK